MDMTAGERADYFMRDALERLRIGGAHLSLTTCRELVNIGLDAQTAFALVVETLRVPQTSPETGQKMAGAHGVDTASRTCAKCGHLWGAYEDYCHCDGPCHNIEPCRLHRMNSCQSCGGNGFEKGNGFAGKPCPKCQQ